MCTRYCIEPKSEYYEELKEIVAKVQRSVLTQKFMNAGSKLLTSGEIRPADVAPVIALNQLGVRTAFPMKWGFRIPGRSLIVNARSETAADKPTFMDSWRQHRCIIPASWYYEWEHSVSISGQKKTGDRYAIRPQGASLTWLCGLYRMEEGLPVFVVITREPTEELRKIHDRMPLILPEELTGAWINPAVKAEDLLPYAVTDLTIRADG